MDLEDKLLRVAQAVPFWPLDDRARTNLAMRMTVRQARFGEVIFERGDVGDAWYLICSGKARVVGLTSSGAETTLAVLEPGEWFGETALVSDAPRSATIRSSEDLTLLRLNRQDFEQLVEQHPAISESLRRFSSYHRVQDFLKESTIFQILPAALVKELVREIAELTIPAGQIVYRESDAGDRMYVVGKGVLSVACQNGHPGSVQQVGQIGQGEIFGEAALLSDTPRSQTVTTHTECQLFVVEKSCFNKAVSASPGFRAALEQLSAGRNRAATVAAAAPAAESFADESTDDELSAAPEATSFTGGWFKRYPHIAQHDETDCAAACLAMITAYYRVPVGVARLRDMANVDADGATMWSVALAAEGLGFHARGLQLAYAGLSDLTLPAIAHWEGYHYIVLYKADAKGVLIADPGLSLQRMSREQFCKGWSGRVLELTPTAKLGRNEPIRSPLRRFWPMVRPHMRLLAEVLAASIVLTMLGLGVPMATQLIVDRVLVNHSVDLLNMLLIGLLGVAVFQAILSAVRRLLLIHVSVQASARLTCEFLQHVMSLPMKFFDLRRVGDVLSRVMENDKIRAAITGTIPGAIVDTVMAVGYAALMFYYSPKVALVSLSVIPPFLLMIVAMTPLIRRNRREHSARDADAWSTLIESITGVATIKAMAVEPPIRWKIENRYVEALLTARRGAWLQTASSTATMLLQTVSTTVLLWYGATQVMAGAMTVGQLLAFTALLAGIVAPTLRLADAWDQLQDLRNAFERLNDVFDARPEHDPSKAVMNPGRVAGNIRFESVTFRYSPSQEKPALASFSIDIPAGQTIAVVGRSGSGKSTLAKLILGLYRPSQGRVLIDGHDLRVFAQSMLRRRIGVVPQDVFLFSGTIRENISAANPDVPFAAVLRAAKQAGADEFVSAMPVGYDTRVGERGMSLSGGQRQRIALARALLHEPSILILDEATSALDTESERTIQRNLESARQNRTTLIIAHRLSTVRRADRIIVLDSGTLVESGTHDELMTLNGLYANLAGQQLNQ